MFNTASMSACPLSTFLSKPLLALAGSEPRAKFSRAMKDPRPVSPWHLQADLFVGFLREAFA